MSTRTGRKYLSGTAKRTRYDAGLAIMDPPEPEQPEHEPALTTDPFNTEDLLWGTYGYTTFLATQWAQRTDEKLDSIAADIYDQADRINQLIIVLGVWFLITLAAMGGLLVAVLR